jgi:hypothetical protein
MLNCSESRQKAIVEPSHGFSFRRSCLQLRSLPPSPSEGEKSHSVGHIGHAAPFEASPSTRDRRGHRTDRQSLRGSGRFLCRRGHFSRYVARVSGETGKLPSSPCGWTTVAVPRLLLRPSVVNAGFERCWRLAGNPQGNSACLAAGRRRRSRPNQES